MSEKNSMKIFLVDDEEITNYINKEVIRIYDSSMETREFLKGQEALEILESDQPDYIFLDLMMPEMNGFQFLEELKNRNINAPVVVLSSSTSPDDKERASNYKNVVTFFSKPLNAQYLKSLFAGA